jgi:hypothetical protein
VSFPENAVRNINPRLGDVARLLKILQKQKRSRSDQTVMSEQTNPSDHDKLMS